MGTTSVINGTTDSVLATVKVGNNPYGVAVDPTTHRVYVVNVFDNTISVIDGTTDTVLLKAIPVGKFPIGVAVDPLNHKVLVVNFFDNTASVIDGTTDTAVANIFRKCQPSRNVI